MISPFIFLRIIPKWRINDGHDKRFTLRALCLELLEFLVIIRCRFTDIHCVVTITNGMI
jgi:hypothetical protein